MGNPILSDDSVGIKIAQALKSLIHHTEITVMETSKAGLSLLDLLIDFDRAIIIDSIKTEGGKVGRVRQLCLGELNESRHIDSCHGINLATTVQFGKQLGLKLPEQIAIFAIEAADVSTFSEELSPEVRKAVPVCLSMIARELGIRPAHQKRNL